MLVLCFFLEKRAEERPQNHVFDKWKNDQHTNEI